MTLKSVNRYVIMLLIFIEGDMIQLATKIPKGKTVYVAFSGGVDSLAATLYYKNKGFSVKLLHFNHGCEYSDAIEEGCVKLSDALHLPITVGYNDTLPKPKQSIEDAWRRARYRFLYTCLPDDGYLVTAHHLNDAVETWIWSSMHGEGKVIEPHQEIVYNDKTCNLVRPFLITTKNELESYVEYSGHKPVPDAYNKDNSLTRNYIRNVMMPHVLKVNPGIEKVIKKKYLNKA